VTTLVVLQPGYLPWLGYFDLLQKADIFVHYDDVQRGVDSALPVQNVARWT
jgi:WbqC-like protein family